MRYRILLVLVGFSLLLAGCSIVEGMTLPSNETQSVIVPTRATPLVPVNLPDALQGAAIYVEKCQDCHGITGAGDGIRASQLTVTLPPIGNPSLVRTIRPNDWFDVITNGKMERLMPAYKDSMDESSRWDVLAYVYALSLTGEDLETGEIIYQQNCMSCHGETGDGEGPKSGSLTTDLPDWTNPASLANLSTEDLYQAITTGIAPEMPTYKDFLSESDRRAVAAYVQSFLFSIPDGLVASRAEPIPLVTGTASVPPGMGIITGGVYNASEGIVPDQMEVTLNGISGHEVITTQVAMLDANHAFRFEGVALDAGLVYIVTVAYANYIFSSDMIAAEDLTAGQEVNLPVEIYDTTADRSQLWADRMHIFLDYIDEDTIQVVEMFLLNNPTNLLMTADQPGNPVVEYHLPAGASNLVFDSGELGGRYTSLETGFGDTQTIPPGAGYQVMFGYDLPFDGKEEIAIQIPVPVNAIVVMAPEGTLDVKGDQLTPGGEREIQGVNLSVYNASKLTRDSSLVMTVSTARQGTTSLAASSKTSLIIGLSIFGLVLVGGGLWLARMQKKNSAQLAEAVEEELESEEEILDQILALDDQFRAGNMTTDCYHQRRTVLVEKLNKIDSDKKNQDLE